MLGNDVSFLSELKRRNVYRVAIAYVIATWLFLQVLELVVSLAGAPDWIGKLFLGLLLIGLPVVLVLSWVYELTPEGVKREKDVDRSASITAHTASRLDKTIIGVFVVAVAWVVADGILLSTPTEPPVTQVAQEKIVTTEVVDKSIAVLPFMNMSEDTGAGHFSDGLADTVLHKLAQIPSLRVVARNSSFQFRGQNVDIRDVGQQLDVANILEGSVQAAGNKIRVTAQLIQADTGYHLWSGNFDRELDDVFAIQDEIAEKVVDALQVSLRDEDTARLTRRETDNVDAFREYSLALREIDIYSFESLPRAIEHLDEAILLDPGYALAWATRALAYKRMNWYGLISDERYLEGIRLPLEKALELDAELPLALALSADLERDAGNVDGARAVLDKAVALAPNDATILVFLSGAQRADLLPQQALDSTLKALELDPLSIPNHQSAVNLLRNLGRYDEAMELSARMRVLNPSAPAGWWSAAYIQADTGLWAAAIMSMQEAHRVDRSDPITAMDMAWYLSALQLDDVAAAWAAKARAIDPVHPVSLQAALFFAVGEKSLDEGAIRLARRQLIDDSSNLEPDDILSYRFMILHREAHRTGYFDEYLAWARQSHPDFFATDIDNVNDSPAAALIVGHTLRAAGQDKQGQRLIDLATARIGAVDQAMQARPSYRDFEQAAMLGDRERALEVLIAIRDSEDIGALNSMRDTRHYPWIREYWTEKAFHTFVASMEAKAEVQRERLLELNGGEYPWPE